MVIQHHLAPALGLWTPHGHYLTGAGIAAVPPYWVGRTSGPTAPTSCCRSCSARMQQATGRAVSSTCA
eukprot:356379-Chlamydomonas_euryale.AAC.10